MNISREQIGHIAKILDEAGIYHSEYEVEIEDFVWANYFDSIHIDGDISFDTLIEIADYLRTCNPAEK